MRIGHQWEWVSVYEVDERFVQSFCDVKCKIALEHGTQLISIYVFYFFREKREYSIILKLKIIIVQYS